MAVSSLSVAMKYGHSQEQMNKQSKNDRDENAKMLRRIAGRSSRDRMSNTEIRDQEQFQVASLSGQIREYKNKLEQYLQRMNIESMP